LRSHNETGITVLLQETARKLASPEQIVNSERTNAMLRKVFFLVVLLSLCTACYSQKPRADVSGAYLLKTAWGGSEPLNMFAPKGSTLGCHASAFAQALYFHKLSPHGKVSYTCTNGTMISEDFSEYIPQWNRFALDKESGKKDISATKETARYIYYVASVVRKDFGTDQYIAYPNDYHKKAVESHFHCTLTAYAKNIKSTIGNALKDQPDFYALLKKRLTVVSLQDFTTLIEKGEGTLGKLAKDDELYEDTKRAVKSVQKAADGISEVTPVTVLSVVLGLVIP